MPVKTDSRFSPNRKWHSPVARKPHDMAHLKIESSKKRGGKEKLESFSTIILFSSLLHLLLSGAKKVELLLRLEASELCRCTAFALHPLTGVRPPQLHTPAGRPSLFGREIFVSVKKTAAPGQIIIQGNTLFHTQTLSMVFRVAFWNKRQNKRFIHQVLVLFLIQHNSPHGQKQTAARKHLSTRSGSAPQTGSSCVDKHVYWRKMICGGILGKKSTSPAWIVFFFFCQSVWNSSGWTTE